jgi:hypothetical protein
MAMEKGVKMDNPKQNDQTPLKPSHVLISAIWRGLSISIKIT